MYPAGVPGISQRFVRTSDGVSIRVIESGSKRNDAPSVLLVHGWGGSVYSFAETIPALAAAGHRVAAIDLPGHGLSDKPAREESYTTHALSNAVREAAAIIGFERFVYVGHSMGGSLGLRLAIDHEPALRGLVLVNAVGIGRVPIIGLVRLLSPPFVNRIVPRLLTRGVVAAILSAAFGTPARPTRQDIDQYWAPTQFDGLAAACRACVHGVTWKPLDARALGGVRVPLLVVLGERDRVVRTDASRVARLIPAARIALIPEGGHLAQQECAERANDEIARFVLNCYAN